MSQDEPMSKLPSREKEFVEESLTEIFKSLEKGEDEAIALRQMLDKEITAGITDTLIGENLINIDGNKVAFTDEGRVRAHKVIRRCRLSERLLRDVLDIRSDELQSAACQFEHVLSTEVTDAICSLLGHPTECPHQNPIPAGNCCQRADSVVQSVVKPLHKMESRHQAKIVYLQFKNNPDAYRLMSLGLLPGEKVRLIQKVPNYILELGEAQIAFDEAIAKDIYVRPLS